MICVHITQASRSILATESPLALNLTLSLTRPPPVCAPIAPTTLTQVVDKVSAEPSQSTLLEDEGSPDVSVPKPPEPASPSASSQADKTAVVNEEVIVEASDINRDGYFDFYDDNDSDSDDSRGSDKPPPLLSPCIEKGDTNSPASASPPSPPSPMVYSRADKAATANEVAVDACDMSNSNSNDSPGPDKPPPPPLPSSSDEGYATPPPTPPLSPSLAFSSSMDNYQPPPDGIESPPLLALAPPPSAPSPLAQLPPPSPLASSSPVGDSPPTPRTFSDNPLGGMFSPPLDKAVVRSVIQDILCCRRATNSRDKAAQVIREVKSGCMRGETMEWVVRGLRSARAKKELRQRGLVFVGPQWGTPLYRTGNGVGRLLRGVSGPCRVVSRRVVSCRVASCSAVGKNSSFSHAVEAPHWGPPEDQPGVSLLVPPLPPRVPESPHDPLHGFSADAAALPLFHHVPGM